MDASYTYEGDVCIHTDPATGFQYKWNSDEKKWEPKTEVAVAENLDSKYEKVGDTYVYKDDNGRILEWDVQAKEWKPKAEARIKKVISNPDEEFDSSDESNDEKLLEQKKNVISQNVQVNSDGVRTYTDPSDGTVFEWDEEKKAWFPKLDEEFIARYQLSYGGEANTEPEPETKKIEPPPKLEKKPQDFVLPEAKTGLNELSTLPCFKIDTILNFFVICSEIRWFFISHSKGFMSCSTIAVVFRY